MKALESPIGCSDALGVSVDIESPAPSVGDRVDDA